MLKKIPHERLYVYSAWIIFAAVAVLILTTFRDYGITWDEELQSQYGLAIVDYYASFFKDDRYAEIFNLYLYGGMFDGLASLIDRFTPFSVYETRHLVNATFGLLGLWGTWRLARFVGNNAVGLIALILLVLTPVYYGHMFNNPKDTPFATGIVWTLYFMARCLQAMPCPKKSLVIRLGAILGLTLGIRVGGVMVFFFWLVPMGWNVLYLFLGQINKTGFNAAFDRAWLYCKKLILPVMVLSYSVMLICWPWAQQKPILNPIRALSEFSNFPQNVEVLLDGTTYMSTKLPWYYVPLYFGIQLPEFILVLLACSIVILPFVVKNLNRAQRQALALILLMGLVPTSYAMIRHPALYDAVRHFLFVVPLVAIVGALTGYSLFVFVHNQTKRYLLVQRISTVAMLTIFGTFIIIQVDIMERLHPYEYIYANSFTGGLPGAYGKYELDYWGTSFKEATQKIQDYVTKEGGVPPGKIYRIAICGPWDAAMINMPPDYEPVEGRQPAEFFLSTTRWMCQNIRPGKEIIRIKRLGVPLSIVKDLREQP